MWSCVLASALLAAGPQVEVQTFSGADVRGQLVELAPAQVVLSAGGQDKTIPIDDLLGVQFNSASQSVERPTHVVLVDGSRLVASSYQVADRTATVKLASGEELKIPTSDVAYVRFQMGSAYDKRWGEILERERSSDRIVIRKDDVLDFLDGVLGTVDDRITFDPGGGAVRVKPEKVFGIIYYHKAGRQLPKSLCLVQTSTGTQLAAAELTLADDKLTLKTPTGLELTRSLDAVNRLDYSQGKIVYLSDLKADVQIVDFASTGGKNEHDRIPPKLDRALDGGPLQIDGRKYAKGVAAYTGNSLTYILRGEYRRFQAVVGIDDSTGELGDALVKIVGRGDRVLYSGTFTGKDKPRGKVVDLDVTGVQTLTLVVEYGPFPIEPKSDHVDFCNARLIK